MEPYVANPAEMFGGGGMTAAEKNNCFCTSCNTYFTTPRSVYEEYDNVRCSYCQTAIPREVALVSPYNET